MGLDGIPLAIELAAARMGALRPAEIAGLLDAVAVAFSMAWLEAGVEGPASEDQARGVLAACSIRVTR